MIQSKADRTREGLMLSMMLSSCADGDIGAEEYREMAIVATEEPEFRDSGDAAFEEILQHSSSALKLGPEETMNKIAALLDDTESRQRGIQLATRIIVADGIVKPSHENLLKELCQRLGVGEDVLNRFVLDSQRRLVRFMLVYLIYLTASSDGSVHPEELELMLPSALAMPIFQEISIDQFKFISESVRSHLEKMREEYGIDYICGTLLKAAELLEDPTIPDQALKLVARGIVADREVRPEEREFFLQVAEKLGRQVAIGQAVMDETIRESQQIRKM